jgi:hypothetical protein
MIELRDYGVGVDGLCLLLRPPRRRLRLQRLLPYYLVYDHCGLDGLPARPAVRLQPFL